MRPTTRMAHRYLRIAAVAAIAALLAHGAAADLVGGTGVGAAVAGKSDETLIAANPVLERLAQESPALLDKVLRRLRAPASASLGERTLERPQLQPTTPAEVAVLADNPDIARYYRESPEAALDLLRLIREAANGE